MSARMTLPEAVAYLTKRDRGCTVYNNSVVFVFHRHVRIGELHAERDHNNKLTVPSLTVAKIAETKAE